MSAPTSTRHLINTTSDPETQHPSHDTYPMFSISSVSKVSSKKASGKLKFHIYPRTTARAIIEIFNLAAQVGNRVLDEDIEDPRIAFIKGLLNSKTVTWPLAVKDLTPTCSQLEEYRISAAAWTKPLLDYFSADASPGNDAFEKMQKLQMIQFFVTDGIYLKTDDPEVSANEEGFMTGEDVLVEHKKEKDVYVDVSFKNKNGKGLKQDYRELKAGVQLYNEVLRATQRADALKK